MTNSVIGNSVIGSGVNPNTKPIPNAPSKGDTNQFASALDCPPVKVGGGKGGHSGGFPNININIGGGHGGGHGVGGGKGHGIGHSIGHGLGHGGSHGVGHGGDKGGKGGDDCVVTGKDGGKFISNDHAAKGSGFKGGKWC
ncbi:hypothetical protein [Thiofilum flexile]|uniref:hypothetical protein n=1 Tax=Thiofilum flexile TaxID=125627 RepID=UPI00036F2CFC|nr:hypothetical protein [Thiofilum flexile]